MPYNRISDKLSNSKDFLSREEFLREKLELPKAVLEQIKDTHLCNEIVDEALSDIREILEQTRALE